MRTIAIVGGGFSGSLIAVNMARFCESPIRLRVINSGFPTGRGVAYGTRRPEHLLNVVARNMSALADLPNHFVDWLRTRAEYADVPDAVLREMFVPRRIYGDYLRSLLLCYSRPVHAGSRLEVELIEGEAVAIEPQEVGGTVVVADGRRIEADKIVLATGNPPPAELPCKGTTFAHRCYCPSPWVDWSQSLPDRREDVVLLGTGLTMVDALLTLLTHDWQGTIYAVSRGGMLPQSHFKGIDYPEFPPPEPEHLGLAGLVALIEDHCHRLREKGENPAIVVDRLRPHTQRIWQRLTVDERREFCQKHSGRWNVTRHRVAREVHDQLMGAIEQGRLRVVRGRIASLAPDGDRVAVTLEDPDGGTRRLVGGLVINCTGPRASFSATASPLLQGLLASGLIAVDELDLGIQATGDFAVIDAAGQPSSWLLAIGPLLKGMLWETTAVPELRGQALRIAQTLLDQCQTPEQTWPVQPDYEVLEYCI